MNKNIIFVSFAVLAGLGMIGCAVLLIVRPDATATFTSTVTIILGLVVTAASTFYGFGKQGEKLEKIERQTNGNLSTLTDENKRLTNLLIERGIDPDAGGAHAKPESAS